VSNQQQDREREKEKKKKKKKKKKNYRLAALLELQRLVVPRGGKATTLPQKKKHKKKKKTVFILSFLLRAERLRGKLQKFLFRAEQRLGAPWDCSPSSA
jgi:hypothetical protein